MSEPAGGHTPLASRVLIYYGVVFVVLAGSAAIFLERVVSRALEEQLLNRLEATARLAADNMPQPGEESQPWASSVFRATGVRVTLIDTEGDVVADSHTDPEVTENHAARPEVVAALQGEVGSSRRVSASTGSEQVYLALPPEDGIITRVSQPTRTFQDELGDVRRWLASLVLLAGLIGAVMLILLSRRIAGPIEELTRQTRAVADGSLDVEPRRSSVRELDQLGLAISGVASALGRRLSDAERASETLEVVLAALPQGTILIDGEDRIAYANPSAYALLGAVPDGLHRLYPFQFQAAVREARERRQPEVRVVEHGKPVRRLRGVATPFSEDEQVLLVVVDITEGERVEAIRRDFVANASHELKTPVATIIASAEAMQIAAERGDRDAAIFARQIEDSARQLDQMVGDLLDLSRLERETPELAKVRLDLVVADEVKRSDATVAEKQISVGLEADPVLVAANHRDLATAVRNLLDNAIRYTDEGGHVSVLVGEQGTEGVLTVEDDGEGIPSRDLARVFERFYRVDSARSRATGGTGLGLAIVKHVAEGLGGSVAVESELGQGSRFTIRIPLADSGEPSESR